MIHLSHSGSIYIHCHPPVSPSRVKFVPVKKTPKADLLGLKFGNVGGLATLLWQSILGLPEIVDMALANSGSALD